MTKIKPIEPENISDEQNQWNKTAEGLLKRILWQIKTGQIKPRELAIAYVDYKGGQSKTVVLETTDHDPLRLNGLLNLALNRHSDRTLYE